MGDPTPRYSWGPAGMFPDPRGWYVSHGGHEAEVEQLRELEAASQALLDRLDSHSMKPWREVPEVVALRAALAGQGAET